VLSKLASYVNRSARLRGAAKTQALLVYLSAVPAKLTAHVEDECARQHFKPSEGTLQLGLAYIRKIDRVVPISFYETGGRCLPSSLEAQCIVEPNDLVPPGCEVTDFDCLFELDYDSLQAKVEDSFKPKK